MRNVDYKALRQSLRGWVKMLPTKTLGYNSQFRADDSHFRRRRRRKVLGFDDACKAAFLVRAVAKWLVGGVSTAAEGDGGAAVEAEDAPLRIDDFKIAFDANRAVIFDQNFSSRHC